MDSLPEEKKEEEENLNEDEEKPPERKEPTFPDDIIQLEHSFGFDCKRLYNMILVDDTLIFASGNYLHYYNLMRNEVTVRPTVYGAGIGFVTRNEHPDYTNLFTVGENGATPTVFIYEYPSHEVRVKLLGAAKACFTCGSYNSTGELFASQAGYPDFMLTIWRWDKGHIILRSKAFQNDVIHVHFSRYNPILLASCGLSHIKFWKMANTFTGLKLQGDLGRFGKTDFSDIYDVYMLPDENVISGCEWGNMLLWEAGLIKFEICRKNRKPCHTKPITRITMYNGEVTTVGMDGYVRIWFWETVDLADPPDDDRFVEIEPIYEFKIGNSELRSIQKIKPFDHSDYGYYGQDGAGGIWYFDLNVDDIPEEPRKLYSCHGGKVLTAQTSPLSNYLITLGEDNKLSVYNYESKTLVLEKIFDTLGADIKWLGPPISDNGMELLAGFDDGVLRHMLLDLTDAEQPQLYLIGTRKGHVAGITKLTIDPSNTILVTCSKDLSIFIYRIDEKTESGLVKLHPLGFVIIGTIASSINWKNDEPTPVLLLGGKDGDVMEMDLPIEINEEETFLSYNLTNKVNLKKMKFVSVKSRIRRDLKREQTKRRKDRKRARKLKEIERLKKANPGLQIDMEGALADSEPEEEEEPLHIPAKPNSVLWLRYTNRDTIWVSMGGYDAGYIYEMQFGAKEPVRCTIIADGDGCEIHSYLTIEDFLISGLINGMLRINHINKADFTDLTDYRFFSMHDGLRGTIPRILISHDSEYIVSIGYDGNIFIHKWYGPKKIIPERAFLPVPALIEAVEDIDDIEYPSLEQEKIFAEIKRQEEAAKAHDDSVMDSIYELKLKFDDIMRQNLSLPQAIQIPHKDMLLDDRITNQIRDELQAELDDVREDLAYDLEFAEVGKRKLYNYFLKKLDTIPIEVSGINVPIKLPSFRLEKLGEDFEKIKEEVAERLRLEAAMLGGAKPIAAEEKEDSMPEPGPEFFFFGRDPNTIIPRFSHKMLRLLRRYRSRQWYEIERIYNWDKLYRQRPDPNKNHPDDEEKIKQAKLTLGDYKLKTSPNYEPNRMDNLTHKYVESIECREKLYAQIKKFNDRLFELRKMKKETYDFIADKTRRLDMLHVLLPAGNRKYFPRVPEIDTYAEYPESYLIEYYKAGCGVNIDDILFLEKSVKNLIPEVEEEVDDRSRRLISAGGPGPIVSSDYTMSPVDMERAEIHLAMRLNEVDFIPHYNILLKEVEKHPLPDDPAYTAVIGNARVTPYLKEYRYRLLLSLMSEQDTLTQQVSTQIRKFDNALGELNAKRFITDLDIEFMESYMIVINQELNILRDSEEIENQLLAKAEAAMKARNEIQAMINVSNRQVDECRKAIDRLNDQIVIVQSKFMSTCKGHKFFDFLRRIFKKKWRPIKPPKENEESSESSSDDSSSSEDEADDTKSVDSTDVTAIRLDESHCPPGLERTIYDLAFTMRADRHALEKSHLEQTKMIELKRIEIIEFQKQMKKQEEVYDQERETLLDFRRKRQQELNKVKVSVILRAYQIQHFLEGEDYRDLSRAVLFDADALSDLKLRVDVLKFETLETRRLHRINIIHLRRMEKDLKFMRYEIVRLETEIKETMMKKFGMIINLDELEEEVLKKYIFELETTAEEELREIERILAQKKREYAHLQEELTYETYKNTERVNMLTVMYEEKQFIEQIVLWQNKNYDRWFEPKKLNLEQDIERLTVLNNQQMKQIECLEREICTLRMKAKPLQMDYDEQAMKLDMTTEMLPKDEGDVHPEMFAVENYYLDMPPDEFIMERIQKIVNKAFANQFHNLLPKEHIRRYAHKVGRYLAYAGNTFEGDITERITECIIENIQTLVPKKYLMHISDNDLRKLLNEVWAVFDYERSEVTTEDVVITVYDNAVEKLKKSEENVLNKIHFVMEHLLKELIEVLPLEEFNKINTHNLIHDLIVIEEFCDPRYISVENLVKDVVTYAKENMLDQITAIPIRRLVENIVRKLSVTKSEHLKLRASRASLAVSLAPKELF